MSKHHTAALLALLAAALAGAAAAAEDKWPSPRDAIGQLWSARMPLGARWTPQQCGNYAALPANVQAVVRNTGSGLVVPQVQKDRAVLTNGLRQMAASLLQYHPATVAAGQFYPQEVDGPFPMNAAYWAEYARSPHGNALNHLPAVNTAGLDLNQCPDLAGLGRQAAMNALNDEANISNSLRWHCYANRFSTVGGEAVPLTGYVEFTQPEYPADNQYAYAAADGRVVYDYVNNRVYYTPAHYKQWKRNDFAPDQTPLYGCTPAGSCCDPFFEIVR
ncbi:hypothetical protein CXB49_13695 [Chromobacterium sp. ATCC 53434]|uniref:hypothetical protein n=1 Tax=Chromobacterium sp. (strain ATCC 53434 / SC 14030) TaxID=2059672 RepID=UPI000C78F3A9|nr:hypothetical protein [Chromobacterium sp. ATCC 53434]AUH51798.1 hypothetical protein CXB49_13695 [Chromobacterium sp. ATCC 53434]